MKDREHSTISDNKISLRDIGYHQEYGLLYDLRIKNSIRQLSLVQLAQEHGVDIGFALWGKPTLLFNAENGIILTPPAWERRGFLLDLVHEVGHAVTTSNNNLSGVDRKRHCEVLLNSPVSENPSFEVFEALNYIIFVERTAWGFALSQYLRLRKVGINIAPEFQDFAEIKRYVWDAIYIEGLHSYPRDFSKLPFLFPKIGRVNPSQEFEGNIFQRTSFDDRRG